MNNFGEEIVNFRWGEIEHIVLLKDISYDIIDNKKIRVLEKVSSGNFLQAHNKKVQNLSKIVSVETRTQVLELGPRDLEPLHHDPHCTFGAPSLM